MTTNAYPQSLTHGAALARIHELRLEAERTRVYRSVRQAGRGAGRAQAWPASLVTALRDNLAGFSSGRTPGRESADPCVACA